MTGSDDICPTCHGTRQRVEMKPPLPHQKILYQPCPDCDGTGVRPKGAVPSFGPIQVQSSGSPEDAASSMTSRQGGRRSSRAAP